MNKRQEIIDAANFVKSLNEDVDVDSVFLVLASKNIKVSKVYVRNILNWGKKPQNKSLKYKIGRNALKITRIAGELLKDNKEISMENIRNFAKEKSVDIENISYATIVRTLEANNFEYKKTFDKDKFSQRRIEMAALTREGWTLQMIADKYGITRQAVSLLLKKAAAEDGQIVVKSKTKRSDPNEKNVVLVKRVKKSLFVCEQCGKEFYSKAKKKNCSKKCYEKSIEDRSGGEWSRKEFVTLTCKTCGKSFERSNYLNRITSIKKGNSENNYCSRNCYHNKNKFEPTQCRV